MIAPPVRLSLQIGFFELVHLAGINFCQSDSYNSDLQSSRINMSFTCTTDIASFQHHGEEKYGKLKICEDRKELTTRKTQLRCLQT